jgi:hypothetical protein
VSPRFDTFPADQLCDVSAAKATPLNQCGWAGSGQYRIPRTFPELTHAARISVPSDQSMYPPEPFQNETRPNQVPAIVRPAEAHLARGAPKVALCS